MPAAIIVLVTCPAAESRLMARSLVEEGLCACVNIIPAVTSIYKWQEKIQEDQEEMLVIKTLDTGFAALRDRVKEIHSYEIPEIISISIEDGYKPYFEWMHSSVKLGK